MKHSKAMGAVGPYHIPCSAITVFNNHQKKTTNTSFSVIFFEYIVISKINEMLCGGSFFE